MLTKNDSKKKKKKPPHDVRQSVTTEILSEIRRLGVRKVRGGTRQTTRSIMFVAEGSSEISAVPLYSII